MARPRRPAVLFTLELALGCVLLPPAASADGPHAPVTPRSGDAPGAVARGLAALSNPITVRRGVDTLGEAWDAARAEAAWNESAPGPRAFAARIGPGLRAAIGRRGVSREDRLWVLRLLVQLADPSSEAFLERVVGSSSCPSEWIARAATGLARYDTDRARTTVLAAFERSVPVGALPREHAWALCEASMMSLGARAPPDAVAASALRLFDFAPQPAVQLCLPLLVRIDAIAEHARTVLDRRGWPAPVAGADPRDPDVVVPNGRGASLLVLAELRTGDALERLEAGARDPSAASASTRDGAFQGLATLGGDRARLLLRQALRDPVRRRARIAHALLRISDFAAVRVLRSTALASDAEIDLRLAAANAYTLLAPARRGARRAWERDLARVGPIGAPFEALDVRLASFATRLDAAERCRSEDRCWAEALSGADPQLAARAFWHFVTMRDPRGEEARLLAEIAAGVLARTPPNEKHDLVAAAVALLARLDPADVRAHIDTVRRARVAWEGRTNPMGLPFDIPLALAQLERKLAPP